MVTPDEIYQARILVVDDFEPNVRLFAGILQDAGYVNVDMTTAATEVIRLHAAHHYDIILLDLQMPGMSGFQVMEKLKALEEADGYVPVLVITLEPDHMLPALQAGAKDFITKPFDQGELLARVYNMLDVRLKYKQAMAYAREQEALALHDSLTGLANRQLLNDRIEHGLAHAKRNNECMGVIYMDLDGFKEVNDNLGHDAGDALLKMVAERLEAIVRGEDTVARLGGDEFVIALPHISGVDDAVQVAAKLIDALARPYEIGSESVQVTASAGIAVYPANGDEVERLCKNADNALYDAKHAGKNQYCVSDRAADYRTPLE
jgi:two-component system cell cycle response regulator